MKNTETLIDENGISIQVHYTYQKKDSEDTSLGVWDVEIKSVFDKDGKDVLVGMSEEMQQEIINRLTYE